MQLRTVHTIAIVEAAALAGCVVFYDLIMKRMAKLAVKQAFSDVLDRLEAEVKKKPRAPKLDVQTYDEAFGRGYDTGLEEGRALLDAVKEKVKECRPDEVTVKQGQLYTRYTCDDVTVCDDSPGGAPEHRPLHLHIRQEYCDLEGLKRTSNALWSIAMCIEDEAKAAEPE